MTTYRVPASTSFTGPPGPQGIQGEPFNVDRVGPASGRAATATDPAIQSYLEEDTGLLFVKRPDGTYPATGIPFRGPKGDAGATGPTGQTGAKGDPGVQGVPGADGAPGAKGDTGATGQTGPQGLTGATGATGAKGDTGTIGPAGPKGDAGERGLSFDPDAAGTRLERNQYDAQLKTFSFLAVDEGLLYFKASDALADWSVGVVFGRGEQGLPGVKGDPGPIGPPGQGVPVGGAAGKILRKKSATNYDTEWVDQTPPTPLPTTATASRTLTADEEFVLASGTITLTLPDASTARRDGYIIKNIGTGTVTVVPSAGDDIDTMASIDARAQWDAVQLRPVAPDSWRIASPLQPETVVKPRGSFRALISANQPISNAAFNKINWDSVPRNPDGWFIPYDAANPTTTARYNPKRPGYYNFAAGCYYASPVATSRCAVTLIRNGAQYAHFDMKHTSATVPLFVGGSIVEIEMNGTTDYIEVHTYHEFGVAKDISSAALQTYFYGGFAGEF